jgi:hypothetical protein
MKQLVFFALLFCSGFSILVAQADAPDGIDRSLPEFSFSELDLAGEMHFLASDFLAGRRTGSVGNEIAAEYIAAQLRAYGYAPINGDSYFQPVPLRKMDAPEEGMLMVGDMTMTHGADLLIMRGPAADVSTNVVFAIFRRVDPERGH